MKTLLLICALTFASACAKAPPTLTPAGATAFQNTQIQKALDLIRDIAQDGNATTPPAISTAAARAVTTWHQAAIITIHDRASGWKATVETGLDQLVMQLAPNEQMLLSPYVALAKTLLKELAA